MLSRALFLSFSMLIGCGSDSDGTPSTTTDTGVAATDSTPTDSATTDSATTDSGMTMMPPSTDLTFDADFIGKGGPNFITGTITLPAGATAGRFVQLEVIRKSGTPGNQVGLGGMTKSGTTLTYKITGLEAGDYQVGARVDQTGNMMVNDPGDYIGFAKGTVAAPKKSSSMADTINVAAPVTGVDFGLGVQ